MGNGLVALTDRRLLVTDTQRVALNVAIDEIRRVQFDIERQRPATLVIVPEHPRDQPQIRRSHRSNTWRPARHWRWSVSD
jgi:hypothetical protein